MPSKQFSTNDNTTTFGMHMMLDAYGVEAKYLEDMKRVYRFLNDLPGIIGMNKLTAPQVLDCDPTDTGKDPGGITGVVLIAESHISIHTFAKRGFFTMDLYSCNNFEEDLPTIKEYIQKIFPYQKEELQVVKRGLEYPQNNV